MGPYELLRYVVGVLEAQGIEYLVTGSMASIAYGEPRLTNDIDIAVRLTEEQAARLCGCFPEGEFYVCVESAAEAVRLCRMFNIIHVASVLKVDFMVARDDDFNRSRFGRGRRLDVVEGGVLFASPEDVILRKLEWYREGRSDKHLRDIRGILDLVGEGIDGAYLEEWIERLGVREAWGAVREGY